MSSRRPRASGNRPTFLAACAPHIISASVSKLKKKAYEKLLKPMQAELNNLAHWLRHTGKRMIVIVEGRDTAGKGGLIGAIAERLNPRQVRIFALAKPSERERTQWYFQRYVAHLPAAGEMVLFDRSWYNRAGIEKVMGYGLSWISTISGVGGSASFGTCSTIRRTCRCRTSRSTCRRLAASRRRIGLTAPSNRSRIDTD